jgi:hypothetical protein
VAEARFDQLLDACEELAVTRSLACGRVQISPGTRHTANSAHVASAQTFKVSRCIDRVRKGTVALACM